MNQKYTKELFEEAVRKSSSISDIRRYIGASSTSGSVHRFIKLKLEQFGIDISHFPKGGGWAKGKHPVNRRNHGEILVRKDRNSLRGRTPAPQLRRALKESGVQHICNICGVPDVWNGKKLVLHIDHIDGDRHNDSKENLRFLCPNCHSQTENFGSKPSGKITVLEHNCIICGKIFPGNEGKRHTRKFCSPACRTFQRDRIEWPNDEILSKLVNDRSLLSLSKEIGVSGNAIKKRCAKKGIIISKVRKLLRMSPNGMARGFQPLQVWVRVPSSALKAVRRWFKSSRPLLASQDVYRHTLGFSFV